MQSLVPNLMVADVAESIAFYEQFGFDLRMAVPEDESGGHDELVPGEQYVYAQVTAGDEELMFQEEASLRADVPALADVEIGGSFTLYARVEHVDELYESLADDVEVVQKPETSWYGMREFYVRDPDGYVLGFAEQVEEP